MTTNALLDIPPEAVESFCHKRRIKELALFGSALRTDFRSDSDVDLLTTFAGGANWSIFDLARMREELSSLLGREADVLELGGLRNPFRRREILATRKVIYAA